MATGFGHNGHQQAISQKLVHTVQKRQFMWDHIYIILCYVLCCYMLCCYIILYYIILYYIILYYIILYYIILYYIILYYIILYYGVLCCAVLCCVILYYNNSIIICQLIAHWLVIVQNNK